MKISSCNNTIDELVSIVIPTYNRADLLANAVNSVIKQDYSNWECIIVDDNSTDETREKCLELIEHDKRIKYLVNNRKKGAQGARNVGVIHSKGAWICFLDSDDCLTQDSISKRINFIKTIESPRQNIGLIYGDFVNISFHKIHGDARLWMARNMALCSFSVMMVNKFSVFKNGYMLDENFPAWQDDDFVYQISLTHSIFHSNCEVALFAPFERLDSISKSYYRLKIGLSLMLKKRKYHILKTVGIKHLLSWYLRLFYMNIMIHKDFYFFKMPFLQKFILILIRKIQKILKNKFDVLYS